MKQKLIRFIEKNAKTIFRSGSYLFILAIGMLIGKYVYWSGFPLVGGAVLMVAANKYGNAIDRILAESED